MTGLREHDFAPSYDKSVDDLANEFYLPCMRNSLRYERISGYFSSAVFSIAWPALKEFVKAGGRMRLICSPVFSTTDAAAVRHGYDALSDSEIGAALIAELRLLLDGERSRKPAQVLTGLIVAGVVDIRIAVLTGSAGPGDRRLFHDKVGLFTDASGDTVGFRGSMNETFLGLSPDGNLESIDVFPSWVGGRDSERVASALARFEELWRNEVGSVDVRSVPEGAAHFIQEASAADWEVLVDEILAEATVRARAPADAISLRDHQIQALAAWELNGRRGLLEHATGSGKTYTAIQAIRTILGEGGSVIVLVPTELLLGQWRRELTQNLTDLSPQVLLAGAGNDAWRTDDLLFPWTSPPSPGNPPRIVVAMMPTAGSEGFLTRIANNDRLLVVADEAHRLGSLGAQQILTIAAPWRLGLSATPDRAGDPQGTARVMDFFGGVLQPPYTLRDAIRDRVLTPYNYLPHEVALNSGEQAAYEDLSRKIRLEAGRRGDALDSIESNDRLRKLAIARARILKRATGKVPLAVRVLTEHCQPGQRWLVYCDGLRQLRQIRAALSAAGQESLEYHSSMSGDREATLTEMDVNGGILVSVRCLDEGIDLPAVTHALILASSRNPREFIQRRGRILRRYPGKSLAFLHDAVVVPAPDVDRPAAGGDRLLAGELDRVLDFARSAANPQALTQIEALCIRYGVPIQTDAPDGAAGIETDTDTEDEDD